MAQSEEGSEERVREYVAEALRVIAGRVRSPVIEVSFHPFAGLSHTIRIRERKVYVRISDIMTAAPAEVLRAVAFILVARLYRQRASTEALRLYREYTYRSEVERASDLARQERRRSRPSGTPRGRIYDLSRLFSRLNRLYFEGELPRPRLIWSQRRTRRILGRYDEPLDTIVISRTLDDEAVPEYAVEFVLYHEMLHLRHPSRIVEGRRVYHPPAFRRDERRFARYEEAQEALDLIK